MYTGTGNRRNGKAWAKWGALLLALVLAISIVGCGKKEETNGTPAGSVKPTSTVQSTASPSATPASKQTTYPLTVKDGGGKEITIAKAPERIVSLAASQTEVLFALGLGDKIYGVDKFSNYPEEAKSKPVIGDMTVNTEAVIAAKPDLIFGMTSMNAKSAEALRGLNLTVYTTDPKTVEGTMAMILEIGKITNTQDKAEKIVAQMKADRQKVIDAVKGVTADQKKKVYVEFDTLYTVGSGEFMDDLISIANATNVASAAGLKSWAPVNEEFAIQQNPDVLLFSKGATDYKTKKPLEEMIKNRNGWDKINAFKNNRVIGIDADLISRPGPRLTQALVDVAKAIYPDLVK